MDINFEIKNLKKKELPKRSEEEINILVESLMSKMTLTAQMILPYASQQYNSKGIREQN